MLAPCRACTVWWFFAGACADASHVRLIPEPEHHLLKDLTAHAVPDLNKTSLAQIEEVRQKQLVEEQAKVAAKYSSADEFTFETAYRRDHAANREELQQQAESRWMAECTFQPQQVKRIMPADDAQVRQNVASVLREDARLRQTMNKEYELLKQYEAELHDASGFYEWQDKMRKTPGCISSRTCAICSLG